MVGGSLKELDKKLHKLELWCSIPRSKLLGLNLEAAAVPVEATIEVGMTRATPGIGWSPA